MSAASTSKSCPSCQAQIDAGSRFCSHCGASLAGPCPACGADLPTDAHFCPACGEQLEGQPPLEERKFVTVLFADLVGSTKLGEGLDAERLKDVMDVYFAAMREEIERFGGTVQKFIGDAVMATFGAPVAHEDDPERALRAAGGMLGRLDEVNGTLAALYEIELAIRIGVNTGEVVAVSAPRADETMVADAVNVAARLEQAAAAGQVLVGARTARASRGFRFEELEPLSVRGREAPVRCFVLVGEADEPRRGIPELRAPLVGRERELALLETVWERVASEGRPHLATIYGDPGVGKSRLVAELAERLGPATGDGGATVMRGRCLPYGDGITYWPLAEVLKQHAGVHDNESQAAALAKIRSSGLELMSGAPDPARAVAALAYTVGVEDPDVALRELGPRQVRNETHVAWRLFFTALSQRAPTVVVIEDIHWADPALLDLLEEIADRAQGSLLLVCPSRPELTSWRPGWGGGKRSFSSIVLEPLGADEIDRLVRSLLAVEDLPASVHRRITERAEGNPFFLEEILRKLIDEQLIVRSNGHWRAAGNIEALEIPDSVQAVLAARIDLLAPRPKRALQHAAVVGRVFWPGPVALLLDSTDEQTEELLIELEDRELVLSRPSSSLEGQPEYLFKHVLTRDVAYDSLPRRDRARAHQAVASWIERTAGERRGEFVEFLAYHYASAHAAARDDPRADEAAVEALRLEAFECRLRAAKDATSKYAIEKAKRLADHALSLAASPLERSRAREALGDASLWAYQGTLAWEHMLEAVEQRLLTEAPDSQALARLCSCLVELPTRWPGSMRSTPPTEEVMHYLELGFSHAGEGESPERLRLLVARAFLPYAHEDRVVLPGELDDAAAAGAEAAAIARRLGRADLESAALDALGSLAMSRGGLYGEAMAGIQRRLELIELLEDPLERGDAYAMAAWVNFHLGDYRACLRLAAAGRERSASVPAVALHVLAWELLADFRLGRWDDLTSGFQRLEEMVRDREEELPPHFAARPILAMALMLELRGDSAAADATLAVATRIETVLEDERTQFSSWIAMLLARRGAFDEALGRLDRAEARLLKNDLGLLHEARCDVIAEAQSWGDAAGVVAAARAHAAEAGLVALPFFADRLEGRAAAAAGDFERALASLGRAAAGFASLGADWDQACAELSLARERAARGDAAGARPGAERALAVFERLGVERERAEAAALL